MDMRAKKIAFCIALTDLAEKAIAFRDAAEAFHQFYQDNFGPTGDAIGQLDIDSSSAKHLTPTIITDAMAAVNQVATLLPAHRKNLRLAAINAARKGPGPIV